VTHIIHDDRPREPKDGKKSDAYRGFKDAVKARLEAKRYLGPDTTDRYEMSRGMTEERKRRYYVEKFKVHPQIDVDENFFVEKLRDKYTEGLCWVLAYYYQGCPSWGWFYPYHYAPFASDFKDISSLDCSDPDFFDLSHPFVPFQQLMSVLPPESAEVCGLPEAMRQLMTGPESPILDFFPADFQLDRNGKRFLWQSVVLLPFFDEKRLVASLRPYLDALGPEDADRNALSADHLFTHRSMGLDAVIRDGARVPQPPGLGPGRVEKNGRIALKSSKFPLGFSNGIKESEVIASPFDGLCDVRNSEVISTELVLPDDVPHFVDLLPGVTLDPQVVTEDDVADMHRLKGFGGEQARSMILLWLKKNDLLLHQTR